MANIDQYLQAQNCLIDSELERLLPAPLDLYPQLFEAARYSVLGGGKRLRPILALAVTELLGGSLEAALLPACTLELIHAYSLIHDDLPCMDDDDYRRGQLTLHKKYSEGHAVLTGDYLLTYAFELLATAPLLTSDQKIQLITVLSKSIGAKGMLGGQVMDLFFEGKKIPQNTLNTLHQHKTGALIMASLEFGSIISNATPIQSEHLRLFGKNIGLAFQIVDDILDVISSEAKHGKSISSDTINEKTTYVSILGLDQSKACARDLYNSAINALEIFPEAQASRLISIADFIINRDY